MRELKSKNDNSIGFVDPYIVLKAPQVVWTPSYEIEVCTNFIRFFVNQKENKKYSFPTTSSELYSYLEYAYFILLIITRSGFYIVIGLTIYMCVNSFHWILMVIEIPKNRLIISESLRKPQENYQ